jgi:DNA-binding PadR family transcriptional regulator
MIFSKTLDKKEIHDSWHKIAKNYQFIQAAQISNSYIILMALSESKEPLTATQISEMIAVNSNGKIFKVSGALKDSLENRLRRDGFVAGVYVPQEGTKKPIRKSLYSITPKGQELLKGWISFLSAYK